MKKRQHTLDRTHNLAHGMLQKLGLLEKTHQAMEELLQSMGEDVAELLFENRESSSRYITERGLRLKELLLNFQNRYGYRSGVHAPLYRQLDRILNSDLSDYLSPAMHRVMEKIGCTDGRAAEQPGLDNQIHTYHYRLGELHFSFTGKIIEYMKNINEVDAAQLLEKLGDKIEKPGGTHYPFVLFPHRGTTFYEKAASSRFRHLSLVEIPGKRVLLGLWCDDLPQKQEKDDPVAASTLEKLTSAHRIIGGRFRKEGSYYYHIDPSDDASR